MSVIWYLQLFQAPTRMPSLKDLPLNKLMSFGACGICRLIRKTLDVPMTASCALIASRAKVALLSCYNVTTVSSCHAARSEEHTSELQSLMRISYAVFCLKNK